MNNKVCEEMGHQYGIWRANEEMSLGIRNCLKCSHEEILPLNKDILEEIKKQEIAKKQLTNWSSLPNDSIAALSGIYPILDNTLNYLDREKKETLINKIKEISISDNASLTNVEYLNYFISYIESENITEEMSEYFYDKVDEFYNINRETFLSLFNNQDNTQENNRKVS